MDAKQFWLTVVVSLIAAIIVSWIMVSIVVKPQLGPGVNVTTPKPLLPDLVVENISVYSVFMNYTNFSYYGIVAYTTIKNIGNARAASNHQEFNLLSQGSAIGISYSPVNPLAPRQSFTEKVYAVSLLEPGFYEAIAYVDVFNQVPESNENNNVYNITFILP